MADLLELLLEPCAVQRGYFKPQAVKQLLDEHLAGRRRHTGRLWILLAFELWHRNFLEAHGTFATMSLSRSFAMDERKVVCCSDEPSRLHMSTGKAK